MDNGSQPVVLIVARDDSPWHKAMARKWAAAVPPGYEVITNTSVQTGITSFTTNRDQIALVVVTDYLPGGYQAEQLLRVITEQYTGRLVIVDSTMNADSLVVPGHRHPHYSAGENRVEGLIRDLVAQS